MTIQNMIDELAARTPQPKEELIYTVVPRPMCDECRDYQVMDYGDICEHCQKEFRQSYRVMYKLGRLRNGFARDAGILYHAVELGTHDYGQGKAFCGTKTGKRSVGWMRQVNQDVTCEKCLQKLARIERRAKVAAEMMPK